MSRLLPLFPLQLVAFPGSAVPLHIFEDRYKEMIGEAAAAGSEFGIILAKDGGIADAGCSAVVEAVLERFPDGRFNMVARGRQRFSLLSVNEEKEYLRGEVEYFDDEEWSPVGSELREKALAAWRAVRAAVQESQEEPDLTAGRLSFQLGPAIDDLDFQSMLLRSRSERERLQKFIDVAGPFLERRQYRAKMRKAAGTNGSGHRPPAI